MDRHLELNASETQALLEVLDSVPRSRSVVLDEVYRKVLGAQVAAEGAFAE